MILCEFSKMAIYEAGGHFDVHRDTVRSHAHQATMLVEVRSTHSGGDLILEPTNGEPVRWSLSSIPSDLGMISCDTLLSTLMSITEWS
jgi:hypothetical protein